MRFGEQFRKAKGYTLRDLAAKDGVGFAGSPGKALIVEQAKSLNAAD